LSPKRLISHKRCDYRWNACPQSHRSGPGSSVMYNRSHAREQPTKWDRASHEHSFR
jgi:hypothetical protein